MAKKLDKARDYAVIVGDDQGRMYEQDGAFFGADGSEWSDPAAWPRRRPAAPPPAPAAADDQVARQLGA